MEKLEENIKKTNLTIGKTLKNQIQMKILIIHMSFIIRP